MLFINVALIFNVAMNNKLLDFNNEPEEASVASSDLYTFLSKVPTNVTVPSILSKTILIKARSPELVSVPENSLLMVLVNKLDDVNVARSVM